MADSRRHDPVDTLLREHIESYEQLGTLLWLRSHADAAWSSEAVAGALSISVGAADDALVHLCARELVVRKGTCFCFGPRRPECIAAVESLAEAYDTRPIDIVKRMTAHALERIRARKARAIADAIARRKRTTRD